MDLLTQQKLIDQAERAMTYTLYLTPRKFNEKGFPIFYDVKWSNKKGELLGSGYLTKPDIKIGLTHCPACLRDNYALNVDKGFCTWCPFDATDYYSKYYQEDVKQ